MKIENMLSSRGNPVINQICVYDFPPGKTKDGIEHQGGNAFFSYGTLICIKTLHGQVYLDNYAWDYSITTGKYRNNFLGEGIQATREKIESGEYTLTKLN